MCSRIFERLDRSDESFSDATNGRDPWSREARYEQLSEDVPASEVVD